MKLPLIFIIFCFGYSKASFDAEGFFGSIGDEMNNEYQNMILGKGLAEQKVCEPVKRSDVHFYLYLQNKNESFELESAIDKVMPSTPLVVIIHGWMESGNGYGMKELKDAYLKRYNCNVVLVDWKNVAKALYSTSVCRLPGVAQYLTNLLVLLKKKKDIAPSKVHLVGHSLGAHVSGLAAQKYFTETGQKIGRITGLDPAGPLYVDEPRSKRLDSTDADFVDAIHTNGGHLGYYGNCGHADFYVNCGSIQPDCFIPDLNTLTKKAEDLKDLATACHHMISFDYMIKMVNKKYEATPCQWCPIGCPPLLSFFKSKTVMGEDCDKEARGGYYISM